MHLRKASTNIAGHGGECIEPLGTLPCHCILRRLDVHRRCRPLAQRVRQPNGCRNSRAVKHRILRKRCGELGGSTLTRSIRILVNVPPVALVRHASVGSARTASETSLTPCLKRCAAPFLRFRSICFREGLSSLSTSNFSLNPPRPTFCGTCFVRFGELPPSPEERFRFEASSASSVAAALTSAAMTCFLFLLTPFTFRVAAFRGIQPSNEAPSQQRDSSRALPPAGRKHGI